jgi:hypothetical protein
VKFRTLATLAGVSGVVYVFGRRVQTGVKNKIEDRLRRDAHQDLSLRALRVYNREFGLKRDDDPDEIVRRLHEKRLHPSFQYRGTTSPDESPEGPGWRRNTYRADATQNCGEWYRRKTD